MFWLYEWMDDRGVTSLTEAERRLSDPSEVGRLHQRTASVPYSTQPLLGADEALLAGRGVDLSGDLDRVAWSCRKQQVDRLLHGARHYFDRGSSWGQARFASHRNGTRNLGAGRRTEFAIPCAPSAPAALRTPDHSAPNSLQSCATLPTPGGETVIQSADRNRSQIVTVQAPRGPMEVMHQEMRGIRKGLGWELSWLAHRPGNPELAPCHQTTCGHS